MLPTCGSLSTSEVKRHRARLVLGWGTAWEDLRVLSAFFPGEERQEEHSQRPLRLPIQLNTLYNVVDGHTAPNAVKRHRVWLVLGRASAWEDARVLSDFLSEERHEA